MRNYQTTSGIVDNNLNKAVSSLPLNQQRTETSGPTWSWTSRFFEPGLINYSIVASQKSFDDPHNAEVVEIKLLLLFNDSFGSLRAGFLTLKGYTMTVDLTLSLEHAPQPEGMHLEENSSSEDGRKLRLASVRRF